MVPTVTSSAAVAGSGFGGGQDKTLTVTASILQANFQNALVGPYSGTMTVSVTP
jgi:hypothetical protein